MEWRWVRGAEEWKRTDDALVDLRATTVSRNDGPNAIWRGTGKISELSRRIDEFRQEVGSVYGTRDVITDLTAGRHFAAESVRSERRAQRAGVKSARAGGRPLSFMLSVEESTVNNDRR